MRRFLVVDDSPSVRLVLASALRAARPGAVVDEAGEPREALDRFLASPPDLVLLDLNLPGGGGGKDDDPAGIDLLMRMIEARPEVPVALVTGLPPMDRGVVDAISLGAAAHLMKPVRADDVRRLLQSLDASNEPAPDYIR